MSSARDLPFRRSPVGSLAVGSQIQFVNTMPAGSPRSNLWTAYASTVDNVTGDAWSEIGVAAVATTTP
jgi:hypothetical protein